MRMLWALLLIGCAERGATAAPVGVEELAGAAGAASGGAAGAPTPEPEPSAAGAAGELAGGAGGAGGASSAPGAGGAPEPVGCYPQELGEPQQLGCEYELYKCGTERAYWLAADGSAFVCASAAPWDCTAAAAARDTWLDECWRAGHAGAGGA